jgi:hypothetical protein
MPRCGSTVLSMHLASMPGVVLLSEVHPTNFVSHPCDQACDWYNLLTPAESELWKKRHGCAEVLALLNERATDASKTLLVREWSYRDFKYADQPQPLLPTWTSSIARHCHHYVDEVLRVSLVREPVDQWLSFQELNTRTGRIHPDDLASCMSSYRRFAEMATTTEVVKFEDFTCEPEETLKYVCSLLDLPYADVGDAWRTCSKVTGDPERVRSFQKVEVLPKKSVSPETLEALRQNQDYLETCQLLDYPTR